MLLCHPYFENYKKQTIKTPLNTIKEFSLFNVEIKFENIENEITFKKELKALNINSLRYKSKRFLRRNNSLHTLHLCYPTKIITKYDISVSTFTSLP